MRVLVVAFLLVPLLGCEAAVNVMNTGSDNGSDGDVDGDSDSDVDADTDGDADTALEGSCADYLDDQGSVGCEFLIATPPFYENEDPDSEYQGPCFAVMIANNSSQPAKLTLSRGDQVFDVGAHMYIPNGLGEDLVYEPLTAEGIPPNQVAVLFVSEDPTNYIYWENQPPPWLCPEEPVMTEITAAIGSDIGQAFELSSDHPVSLYDIVPYGGAPSYLPSASLLFPYTSWGTNYVVSAPHDTPSYPRMHWLIIVASEDETIVDIVTNASSNAVSFAGLTVPTPGLPTTYTLDRGEYLQLGSEGFWPMTEYTGSVIESDKPVGVYSGTTRLQVSTLDNTWGGATDAAHQQIPHVGALSYEYLGVGIPSRIAAEDHESVLYRIVGVVPGTDLTWSPSKPDGAPSFLTLGETYEFETRDYFHVTSQEESYPFSLTQYMGGYIDGGQTLGGCFGVPLEECKLGDDDWIILVPPVQFLKHYAFFTDPTYGVTSVSVIRVADAGVFSDVTLSCAGVVGGWEPVGSDGKYEVAQVHLYRGGVGITPECETSQHSAGSDQPFGLVVWGVDVCSSYGYAAGGSIKDVNNVEVPVIE